MIEGETSGKQDFYARSNLPEALKSIQELKTRISNLFNTSTIREENLKAGLIHQAKKLCNIPEKSIREFTEGETLRFYNYLITLFEKALKQLAFRRIIIKGNAESSDRLLRLYPAASVERSYKTYQNSSEFLSKRQEVLTRDSFRCRDCGNAAEEVHHLDYYSICTPLEVNSMISLCGKCHYSRHFDIKSPVCCRCGGVSDLRFNKYSFLLCTFCHRPEGIHVPEETVGGDLNFEWTKIHY